MRFRSFSRVGLVLLNLAAGALALSAQENTVWRIGNFDHTAAEFGGSSGNQPIVVDADAPDAARRWPASQAGTLNAASGPESHSRTIQFRLNEAPRGSFSLDLAVMAGNPRTPRLELDVNGTPAWAYLDRRLSYHAEGRADSPICAEARVRIPVPASALRQGANALRITAVDDAPDENGDSQISWDALALMRSEQAAGEPAVAVEPTYFFANQNGVTRELVTATVTSSETVLRGMLTLSVAGTTYRADLALARFGQQRFEFWVAGVRCRDRSPRRPRAQRQDLRAGRAAGAETQTHGLRSPAHPPRHRLHRLPAEDRRAAKPQSRPSAAKRCAAMPICAFRSMAPGWRSNTFARARRRRRGSSWKRYVPAASRFLRSTRT